MRNEDELLRFIIQNIFPKKTEEVTAKCDIIDIANEEMKNIDSSEIDLNFKEVFVKEATENILKLVAQDTCEKEDIEEYKKRLNDDDILDIRVSGTLMYIKTKKDILPITLANILQIEEKMIEKVPITARFNFYVIQAIKWQKPISMKFNYIPEHFVDELKYIGSDKYQENEDAVSSEYLFMNIADAVLDADTSKLDGVDISVEIEDQVVAIEFNEMIFDIKNLMANILKINPDLFIEIVTPIGSALLIDTRRWALDDEFGDEQWYL